MSDKILFAWIEENILDSITEETKSDFLKDLKHKPENIKMWFKENLLEWSTIAREFSGEVIAIYDVNDTALSLVTHCKEKFKNELDVLE